MTTPRTTALVVLLAVGALAACTAVSRSGGGARAVVEPLVSLTSLVGPADRTTTAHGAAGLDPGLVAAFERARQAAADAGHTLVINSGFRTAERQQQLLDEEVAERGSHEEATRWVFPPDRSMHVQGLAIDVGDGPAADWLEANGARFGLCHTLAWEWWHYEWRARWEQAGTCPPPAQDPSQAPGR